jgi:hypothetical protein
LLKRALKKQNQRPRITASKNTILVISLNLPTFVKKRCFMYADSMPTLKIGNLEISPPIIQGGMGVRVSRANLAGAVANQGCAGVIASAGIGRYENYTVK